MSTPSNNAILRSFGGYGTPRLGLVTFFAARGVLHDDTIVADVPLAVMRHLIRNATNPALPFDALTPGDQSVGLRKLLSPPAYPTDLPYAAFREGQLTFHDGRHRLGAMLHFEAPVIPLELDRASGREFTETFAVPVRPAAAFAWGMEERAARLRRGDPPGLIQTETATLSDDLKLVKEAGLLNAAGTRNLVAEARLIKVGLLEARPGGGDSLGADLTKARHREIFLHAWCHHLEREVGLGHGDTPTQLPMNWETHPVRTAKNEGNVVSIATRKINAAYR